MKTIITTGLIALLLACGKGPESSIEMITAPGQQDSLFQGLIIVTRHSIPEPILKDSLAFLVLPVQASCPSCRKKTIDSIVRHATTPTERHYIIISANGGHKTIRGYFQEQEYEMPAVNEHFFLDSTNLAYKAGLYKDKPTLYYTYNGKAYKKVAAIPATVRDDLREFFSGHRQP